MNKITSNQRKMGIELSTKVLVGEMTVQDAVAQMKRMFPDMNSGSIQHYVYYMTQLSKGNCKTTFSVEDTRLMLEAAKREGLLDEIVEGMNAHFDYYEKLTGSKVVGRRNVVAEYIGGEILTRKSGRIKRVSVQIPLHTYDALTALKAIRGKKSLPSVLDELLKNVVPVDDPGIESDKARELIDMHLNILRTDDTLVLCYDNEVAEVHGTLYVDTNDFKPGSGVLWGYDEWQMSPRIMVEHWKRLIAIGVLKEE